MRRAVNTRTRAAVAAIIAAGRHVQLWIASPVADVGHRAVAAVEVGINTTTEEAATQDGRNNLGDPVVPYHCRHHQSSAGAIEPVVNPFAVD